MNPDLKREFREHWAIFAEAHREDITPIEWVEMFSLLSGIVLGLCCDNDDAAENLLDASKQAAFQLYRNVRDSEQITLQ